MKPAVRTRERGGERLEVLVDLGDRTIVIGKYRNSVEASRRRDAITRIIEAAYDAGRQDQAGRNCATCLHASVMPDQEPCKECGESPIPHDKWTRKLAGGVR